MFQTVISRSDSAFTQLLGINTSGTIDGYFGDGTIVLNNAVHGGDTDPVGVIDR